MIDLSLRQYFQQKGANPISGVRKCAPGLKKTISLKKLIGGIKRRIIHLSDLHIGLNNDPVPADQVNQIIDAIIREYPKQDKLYEPCDPIPIVVITGDLVDYYSPVHLDTAFELLKKLKNHGFTVLVIPGNHDYSDSFSIDTFTPLENIPGIGDLIKIVADLANTEISKGQDHNLVSGLTYSPVAASDFQAKMAPFLGENGYHQESWKDQGAVYDLDFILLDGQDKEAHRPDWDDPRRFVQEKVRDAVLAFDHCPAGVNKNTLADTIADAVAALTLDPVTIYSATLPLVSAIEETVYEPVYLTTVVSLSAAALLDPTGAAAVTLASLAITAHPILKLLDLGLAATVASVAATAVTTPLLDDKFFLHSGDFRLAHGYLDDAGLQFFQDRVDKDHVTNTLPIACIHYWLNYPSLDTQSNNNSDNSTHNLTNESALFETLDKCYLLLVGHIHRFNDGSRYTFQQSSQPDKLSYYSRVGSTIPAPAYLHNLDKLKDYRTWQEITINLNTKAISTAEK